MNNKFLLVLLLITPQITKAGLNTYLLKKAADHNLTRSRKKVQIFKQAIVSIPEKNKYGYFRYNALLQVLDNGDFVLANNEISLSLSNINEQLSTQNGGMSFNDRTVKLFDTDKDPSKLFSQDKLNGLITDLLAFKQAFAQQEATQTTTYLFLDTKELLRAQHNLEDLLLHRDISLTQEQKEQIKEAADFFKNYREFNEHFKHSLLQKAQAIAAIGVTAITVLIGTGVYLLVKSDKKNKKKSDKENSQPEQQVLAH